MQKGANHALGILSFHWQGFALKSIWLYYKGWEGVKKKLMLLMQESVAKKVRIITIMIDNQYFMRQAHILLTRICPISLMLYKF